MRRSHFMISSLAYLLSHSNRATITAFTPTLSLARQSAVHLGFQKRNNNANHGSTTGEKKTSLGLVQTAIGQESATETDTLPRTKAINNKVPSDFGKIPGGTPICNKDDIFDEIDKALGVDSPPDFEVILTDHLTYTGNPISKFLHLNLMRFGHIAIRYTTSDGKSRVMNILGYFEDGDENTNMVNFFTPSEYFYGTKDEKVSGQQWGLYNRPYVGVRVENVAKGATDALHEYFEALAKACEIEGDDVTTGENVVGEPPAGSSNRGAARFQLVEVNLSKIAREVPAPFDKALFGVADWIRNADDRRKKMVLSAQSSMNGRTEKDDSMDQEVVQGVVDARQAIYHSGNCAQWTSGGLDFVGMIRRPHLFPKSILVDILEDEHFNNRKDNVHVVYYDEIQHAVKNNPDYKCLRSAMVSPLKPIRTAYYDNMKEFADVIVEVPRGSTKAVLQTVKNPKQPTALLPFLSLTTTYVPAAVLVGLVDHIGPIGPTAAAGWLALNWWLY